MIKVKHGSQASGFLLTSLQNAPPPNCVDSTDITAGGNVAERAALTHVVVPTTFFRWDATAS